MMASPKKTFRMNAQVIQILEHQENDSQFIRDAIMFYGNGHEKVLSDTPSDRSEVSDITCPTTILQNMEIMMDFFEKQHTHGVDLLMDSTDMKNLQKVQAYMNQLGEMIA